MGGGGGGVDGGSGSGGGGGGGVVGVVLVVRNGTALLTRKAIHGRGHFGGVRIVSTRCVHTHGRPSSSPPYRLRPPQ